MKFTLALLTPILVLICLDIYVFQSVKAAVRSLPLSRKNTAYVLYWMITVITVSSMVAYRVFGFKLYPPFLRSYFTAFLAITFLSKVFVMLFLIGEDASRFFRWVSSRWKSGHEPLGTGMSRSEFLNRLALGMAAIPMVSLVYGMVANAYNYRYRKVKLSFPHLPEAFNGFRIIQLSDIHSGSFTRVAPVREAVEKINQMDADLILFTGDLVNNVANEMDPFKDIFSKLKARYGVMSVTGNHDYGDYVNWNSVDEKAANFKAFLEVHAEMGWDLLMNTHRIIEKEGQKLAVIGIENWGNNLHFPKYGKLAEAKTGAEEIPFKILLSHDPSHWDAQVRPEHPDIDLMLSGHTHGFQFGIDTKWLKWSPSQFVYKQWAGLYQEGRQYLYVNRGFGFLGYPGRVGILPEITEITLCKA